VTDQETILTRDLSKILFSRADIAARIERMGVEITARYAELEIDEISVICVTNGSIIFAADLLRELVLPLRLDCIRVSSYQNETRAVSEPNIIDTIRLDISGRHVLLIDDIFDTGKTLEKIRSVLLAMEPASLKTCVLLCKQGRQVVLRNPDFVGFEVPDEFVVGYGLDFAEHYRNLPCIGVLRPELQNPPEWL
jgi:hypoxanthine phosphoribosyltransferase